MSALRSLWKRRIASLVKLYYQFLSFQVDWVILIYLLAFLMMIGYGFYPSLINWLKGMEQAVNGLLFTLLMTAGILTGKYHGFLKAADEVFLSPLDQLGRRFVTYSRRLSLLLALGGWTLLWGVVSLLLIWINPAQTESMPFLWLVGSLLKLIHMNLRDSIFHQPGKWRRRLLGFLNKVLLFLSSFYLVQNRSLLPKGITLAGLLLVLILSWMSRRAVKIQWARWISAEVDARVGSFAILLRENTQSKPTVTNRTLSIFSGRGPFPFSPLGAMLMLYTKMLLRNRHHLALIAQMTVSVLAMQLIFPDPLFTTLVAGFYLFLMGGLLCSIWYQLQDSLWLKIYPIPHQARKSAFYWGPGAGILVLVTVLFVFQFSVAQLYFSPAVTLLIYLLWGVINVWVRILLLSIRVPELYRYNIIKNVEK